MNPYQDLEMRAAAARTPDEAFAVLRELLEGGFAVWTDGALYSIKHLVGQERGLQFHVFANDHMPPHFHVKGADVDAAFAIKDCALLKGEIGGRDKRLVEWWHEKQQALLVASWNDLRPSDRPSGPPAS